MTTIAICNQKGGVGKTTTTFNLGACLAKKGKKVLLVDLDPQGNLSSYCQFDDEEAVTIADLITSEIACVLEKEDILGAIRTYDKTGIDYIPANIGLSVTETQLVNATMGEWMLSSILKNVADKYDYCIIDCLPSLGQLFTNALFASDKAIVPVQTQKFAKDGLSQLFTTVKQLQTKRTKIAQTEPIKIIGIIPTMTENTNISKKVMQALQEQYSGMILPEIKKRIAAANASDTGIAVSGELGEAYMAIADIVEKGGE